MQRYDIATGIVKQEGLIRVAIRLSVHGEDAAKVYDTFTWADNEDEQLRQFDRFCQPRTQFIYERYKFSDRIHAVDESISAQWLRTMANNYGHEDITPDDIFHDRLVLDLKDDKMRERMLGINDLSLK